MIGENLQPGSTEKEQIIQEESIAPDESSESFDPGHVSCEAFGSLTESYANIIEDNRASIFESGESLSAGSDNRRCLESRYHAIVENSMDNIYICDAKSGKIIEFNESMRHLLGYTIDEMNDLTVFDFLDHPEDEVKRFIGLIIEKGSLKIKDRRYRRKDGHIVNVDATCCMIEEEGQPLICVVSRDVSERKDHERMLIKERNKAELYLDILSHDIGNLHQGILGFVKLCKQQDCDPDRSKSYIHSIDSLTVRSIHLVNNLKILGRINLKTDEMIDLDPEEMIGSCMRSVKASIPWKDPVFDVDIPVKKMLLANPNIGHAIYNVLHNAVKYQKRKRPRVEIKVRESEDGYLRISVRDHGCGIPATMRKEVLNRVDLNKKHGGLGLTVVRALMEESGGLVRIEDPEDEEEGTVLIMEFPIFS